ncbi:hypothetical protein BJV77DRAFT_949652, partial [Russula vinacea]
IIEGCHRLSKFSWHSTAIFFFWSQLIAVQAFSVLSSLSNLQPWRSCDLVVMVIILYISFAANVLRITSFLIDRSERYPRSGAFPVGLLGNIYFRPFGGAALTAMVAGVLFLVPSGLSVLIVSGSGIGISGAMTAITIGVTVGQFHFILIRILVYLRVPVSSQITP